MRNNVRAKTPDFGEIPGGFIRVEVGGLMAAWKKCQASQLGIRAFRAWLVAHEMLARRRQTPGRKPRYGIAELAQLLGVGPRAAAAAVRRLDRNGLIAWAESAITFPAVAEDGHLDGPLADTIGGGVGTILIPRRLLCFLARGARASLVATVLAALLRCVSRRKEGYYARGRFQASWVARAFGIAERHAKAARAELVAKGWLESLPGDQWAWNRWGRAYLVRLDWAGPDGDRHPSPASGGRRSSPPDLHPDPLREGEHPEPAVGGPTGASRQETGTDRSTTIPDRCPVDAVKSTRPAPDLRDIRVEDLADTGRALELHRQAVERGRITASEADRVRFLAAAEHARAIGKTNPAGLLARIVGRGWWHLLTQQDEDRAARRLREHGRAAAASSASWRSTVLATAAASPSPTPSSPPQSPVAMPRRGSTDRDGPARQPTALADVLARMVAMPAS